MPDEHGACVADPQLQIASEAWIALRNLGRSQYTFFHEPHHCFQTELHTGCLGVVDHDRLRHGIAEPEKMIGNVLLQRLHEPRNQHHEAICAFSLGPFAQADRVSRGIAASARIDRDTLGARLNAKRDNLLALLIRQANKFAATPAGTQPMRPRIHQPLDMASRCWYIDAILGHYCYCWCKNTTYHKNPPPFGHTLISLRQRKSRDDGWVDDVLVRRPAPAQNINNILDRRRADVFTGLHRPSRHMRRQNDVLHVGEWVQARRKLLGENINHFKRVDPRTAQPSLPERINQRRLIHQCAARGVDQACGRLHLLQRRAKTRMPQPRARRAVCTALLPKPTSPSVHALTRWLLPTARRARITSPSAMACCATVSLRARLSSIAIA